jgi:hypothetical protein
MAKFVFFNALDGGIILHLSETKIGFATSPYQLAGMMHAQGIKPDEDSFYFNSDCNYAIEHGFTDGNGAHNFITEAIDHLRKLIAEGERKNDIKFNKQRLRKLLTKYLDKPSESKLHWFNEALKEHQALINPNT